jgi:hypothetical protein
MMIKFIKISLARVEAGAQAEKNYSHTPVAEKARAARKKASFKVVQKGGVIYTEQARKKSNSGRRVMLKLMQDGLHCLKNAKSSPFSIGSIIALLQPVIESAR